MAEQTVVLGACTIELSRREVTRGEAHLTLTEIEAKLLEYLMSKRGTPASRDDLLRDVWDYAPGLSTRAVDNTVMRLRQKIEHDPSNPEHLLSIRGLGYRLDCPHLRTTNLPTQLDSFFGREPELAELEQRVAGGQRLITVLGAAGTGKTRLAQRLGRNLLDSFSGAVWFCDLTEARSTSGILSAMGTALDVPLTQQDPEAQLADAILGRGRVLIILDNFEHVVEHAPDTVGRWLQRAPEAAFLVTSRTLLRIAGEEVFTLDPLPVPEAVSLFFDRARAVHPDFARSPDNEPVVTEIVERLDCMSLAVELAAARVRMLPPEKILSRLSERFKLLGDQRRDPSDRQATLRGTIDWSWELLKPDEQAALSQLSVFHGGCTLEAAEAVLDLDAFDEEPWVMDVVQGLVDHSLLRRTEPHPGHVRYRMLESIREYSAEKLGDETAATALRHAQHFASLDAETSNEILATHSALEQHTEIALELENLVVGVDAGLAAGDAEAAAGCALLASEVLGMHGPFSEGLALLDRVSEQPICRGTQAHVVAETGWLLKLAGRIAEALEQLQVAIAIAREVGNRRLEGKTIGTLAGLHWALGQTSEAVDHHHQALAIAREDGNRRLEATSLGNLGQSYHQQGRISEALEHLLQALAIHRDMGVRRLEAITLGNLAILHLRQGRMSEAQQYFQQALAIHRAVGNRRLEGTILGNLAHFHFDQGRIPEAQEHFQQALAIHQAVGNRREEGAIFADLALLHYNVGHISKAQEHFHQALLIHREMGNRRGEGAIIGNLGDILFTTGDLPAAEGHFREAIAIGDETWPISAGAFRGSLALIRAQQGDFDEARTLLASAEPQLRGVHKLELGKLLSKKARVEHLAGDPAAAAAALAEAEGIATELGAGPDSELGKALAEAREVLAQ